MPVSWYTVSSFSLHMAELHIFGRSTMRGSRGGGAGSPDPTPWNENYKNIGFLSIAGPDPLQKSQSYQAGIQGRVIIGPPVKRHLAGGPMMARF